MFIFFEYSLQLYLRFFIILFPRLKGFPSILRFINHNFPPIRYRETAFFIIQKTGGLYKYLDRIFRKCNEKEEKPALRIGAGLFIGFRMRLRFHNDGNDHRTSVRFGLKIWR